jgi:CRISPR-associated protein Csx14
MLVTAKATEVTRLECNGLEVKPIIAALTLSFDGGATQAITLDAWTKIQSIRGVPSVIANRPWNFWSGQQTSFGIWCALREVLASQLSRLSSDHLQDIFNGRVFQKGRFGFDPLPAWNALDAGFSPNEQNMMVESSAAVELLAAVGLQRFRPVVSDDCESFVYGTWTQPLDPAVAAAAMCGAIPTRRSVLLRGTVVNRGQYAALGHSFPVHEGVSDG